MMNRKNSSGRLTGLIALAVFVTCYGLALMMSADRPVHESDCRADTLTCAQEAGQ